MKTLNNITVILFFIACSMVNAQTTTKLDLRLWHKLQNGELGEESVRLLVKGEPKEIKGLVEKLGGTFNYNYGYISSVVLPSRNLRLFSENENVEKIENTQAKGCSLLDSARIQNNVDSVHHGLAPLVNGLKGKDVIVGIIDGGIYWQHLDFRNPNDSSTRIRYIWDQRYYSANSSNRPLPYNYGTQWNWLEIDNRTCAHTPPYRGDSSDAGHGTAVAGIAVGNSLSTKNTAYENQLTGVAPESEIIAVRVNYETNFLSNVADAVDYVFKKADALGKPCVINTSIGTYYGSHDGKDLASQIIDALVTEKNGRSVVAAAGNGGNSAHHVSYQIPPDSAYTFFKYIPSQGIVYFDLWADTAEFQNAYFKVGCNDTLGSNLGATDYFNVPVNFNPPNGTGIVQPRNLFNNNLFLGKILIEATLDEGRYHVEFLIEPANASHFWRLQTTGSGTFDLWSSSIFQGTSDITSYIKTGDINNPQVYIQYTNYRHPDTLKTLVSAWQNSDKVITVGNYSNRSSYLDKDSNLVDLTVSPYTEVPGKKVKSSSLGPTRDGRMKPDVIATGNFTFSSADANYLPSVSNDQVYVSKKHFRYGGTSISSPIVTGIAALYLEKRPTATYDEIKQAIICTAKRDSFTGITPNYEYGYGKVDAFGSLTAPFSCFIFGAKDSSCINYNLSANTDTGGCIPKIYGCMDTAANNYNPLANVSNGSCNYSVGIQSIKQDNFMINAFPNPMNPNTIFILYGEITGSGSLVIFDQLGQQCDEIKLIPGKDIYPYFNTKLSKGIYCYHAIADGKNTFAGKIIVE